MIVFILNMVSVSMVMMAAIVLIVLRERTDTQLLMAAVCLEAMVALGSLMWIEPSVLDVHFLFIHMLGQTLQGLIMWGVIVHQVRGIKRLSLEPTIAEVITKDIKELKRAMDEIKADRKTDDDEEGVH